MDLADMFGANQGYRMLLISGVVFPDNPRVIPVGTAALGGPAERSSEDVVWRGRPPRAELTPCYNLYSPELFTSRLML